MKYFLIGIFLLSGLTGFSQTGLNDYKYIVVPKRFDAFKKENQYKTSTLIKHLFAKNGFNAVYEDALPEELSNNRCLGLLASINDESNMFTTKAIIVLKDCSSKEVFVSEKGDSKDKDYVSAYNEALKEAFESIRILDYKYAPKEGKNEPITVSFKNDVKTIEKNKVKESKNKVDKSVVKQVATPDTQLYKSNEPISSGIKKAEPIQGGSESKVEKNTLVLYAQEISNGFQLVDSTPMIRIKIFKSSMPNYYMAQTDDKNGIVYKKGGVWFFEYYEAGTLKKEELNIKF